MEAVRRLLELGASKEITDQMERCPRDAAAENGHDTVANYLDAAMPAHLRANIAMMGSMTRHQSLPRQRRQPATKVKSHETLRTRKSLRTLSNFDKMAGHKRCVVGARHFVWGLGTLRL